MQELLEILGIPYTGPGVRACMRSIDKVAAKQELRAAGIPTPDWVAFNALAFRELGAAETLDEIGATLGYPLVVKPAAGARRSAFASPPRPREVPEALVAAFSYDDRVLIERHVDGREIAVSIVDGIALPVVEARPARRGPLHLRGALRDRPHRVHLPGAARRCRGSGARRASCGPGTCSASTASAAST